MKKKTWLPRKQFDAGCKDWMLKWTSVCFTAFSPQDEHADLCCIQKTLDLCFLLGSRQRRRKKRGSQSVAKSDVEQSSVAVCGKCGS